MSWRLLEASVDPRDADLASGVLWGHSPDAVHEETEGGRVVLRATFATAASLESAGDALRALGPGHPVVVRTIELDDDEVRAAADGWRAHATAVRAGERLVVVPAWVPLDAAVAAGSRDVLVRIDPGLSFGSGAHPTTRLELAALEAFVTNGCSVLDVGTGSGVLAIAAALLGAGRVRAVDVDPEAVAAAVDNVASNAVVVDVDATPVGDLGGRYDLVLANMLAPVLVELAPALVARTGRVLLVSGVLTGRWDHVVAALAPLVLTGTASLDGWDQLTFLRPGTA